MFLNRNRLHDALSSLNHVPHCWAAIPPCNPHDSITQMPSSHPADAIGKQSLCLTSWNIQTWPIAHSKLILDHILKGPKFSNIIHLQEVPSSAQQFPLDNPRVCSGFLMTNAEDDTSYKTMTLLSSKCFGSLLLDEEGKGGGKLMLDSIFCMELPSRYRRDTLCVNIATPAVSGAIYHLLNVHLDSLNSHFQHALQMLALALLLHEPRCRGGIITGDFNAILPKDHRLINEHGLLDACIRKHWA